MAMSAGICGKRVGYEEIFGSSPPPCSSSKKPRRSSSDETALDSEVLERLFRNNNGKVEDAMECLSALSSVDILGRDQSQSTDSVADIRNCDQNQATCSQMWEETHEDQNNAKSNNSSRDSRDGIKWVELFVDEMMNAANIDDARGRAARILEAFEQCISEQTRVSKEVEHASLKEHLQRLLNDNQILKRAVAIQHERHLEQEENTNGVQQLKNVLNQYQEKVRSLELSNYALKVHLERARESSFISGQFMPDIF
ncbi:CUE domain-containing protein [Senna tora]|uniref:CUE domain-containing protein n=1 Tax=Senna tora TaxID=362788 RepID=A0A834SJ41_9FABA|nr:CUE domain-containing protein [Senna tora]